MRFNKLAIGLILVVALLAGFFLYMKKFEVNAASPTKVLITLYKTELYTDKNGTPLVVFDNPSGKEVDIVQSGSFGEGNIPDGTYKRIRFTVKPQGRYSGPNPCGQGQITDQTFTIGAQEIYFATADDGGSTAWTANGSKDKPFLMQNPIVVQGGKTTQVRLIFNTAETLQCQNNAVVLFPPTMNVVSIIKDVAAQCSIGGQWWFVHYNISVNTRICDDASCSTYHHPKNIHELFERTTIVSGWGTVTFDDANNKWTVNAGSTYENQTTPGMAEHRHTLLNYDPSRDGYRNPAGQGTFTGTYSRSGNNIIMYFPGGGYIEGAVSSDCKTFTGVFVTGDEDNDIVFAVKKKTDFPSQIPAGKYVLSFPNFNFNFSNYDNKVTYFSYTNQMDMLDTQLNNGTLVDWYSYTEYHPQYDANKMITSINISHPQERFRIETNALSGITIRNDGLLGVSSFAALGENGNGVMAGEAQPQDDKNDHIEAGFIIKLAENPVLSDLNGTWKISALESEVDPGSNGWNTGDEKVWYGLTYGEVKINNGVVTYRSFIHKNIFDGTIKYEVGSGETIELKTECYKPGISVTAACADQNAPRIRVFYIYGTGSQQGKVIAKMALDSSKKAIVFWAPIDLNETPPVNLCPNSSNNEYCDPTGGGLKGSVGMGVKVE